jgi:putative transcriptional regulator
MKNNLKIQRAKLGITQSELAKKVGVSRQSINAIEAGKFNLSTTLALKISRVFNLMVNDIFLLDSDD